VEFGIDLIPGEGPMFISPYGIGQIKETCRRDIGETIH